MSNVKKGEEVKSEGMKQIWFNKTVGEEVTFQVLEILNADEKKVKVMAEDGEEFVTFIPSTILSRFVQGDLDLNTWYVSSYKGKARAKSPNAKTGRRMEYNDYAVFEGVESDKK